MHCPKCLGDLRLKRGLRDVGQPVIVTVDGEDFVYSADKRTCVDCGNVVYGSPGEKPICKLVDWNPAARLVPVRP